MGQFRILLATITSQSTPILLITRICSSQALAKESFLQTQGTQYIRHLKPKLLWQKPRTGIGGEEEKDRNLCPLVKSLRCHFENPEPELGFLNIVEPLPSILMMWFKGQDMNPNFILVGKIHVRNRRQRTVNFFVTVNKRSPEKRWHAYRLESPRGVHRGSRSCLHLEEWIKFSKAEGNREVILGEDSGQNTEGKWVLDLSVQ